MNIRHLYEWLRLNYTKHPNNAGFGFYTSKSLTQSLGIVTKFVTAMIKEQREDEHQDSTFLESLLQRLTQYFEIAHNIEFINDTVLAEKVNSYITAKNSPMMKNVFASTKRSKMIQEKKEAYLSEIELIANEALREAVRAIVENAINQPQLASTQLASTQLASTSASVKKLADEESTEVVITSTEVARVQVAIEAPVKRWADDDTDESENGDNEDGDTSNIPFIPVGKPKNKKEFVPNKGSVGITRFIEKECDKDEYAITTIPYQSNCLSKKLIFGQFCTCGNLSHVEMYGNNIQFNDGDLFTSPCTECIIYICTENKLLPDDFDYSNNDTFGYACQEVKDLSKRNTGKEFSKKCTNCKKNPIDNKINRQQLPPDHSECRACTLRRIRRFASPNQINKDGFIIDEFIPEVLKLANRVQKKHK